MPPDLQSFNLIIGEDNRQALTEADTSYAHAVGIISVDGKNRCSAFTVSTRRLVTAVHCLGKEKAPAEDRELTQAEAAQTPSPIDTAALDSSAESPSSTESMTQPPSAEPGTLNAEQPEAVIENAEYSYVTLSGKSLMISRIEKIHTDNDVVYFELAEDAPDYLLSEKVQIGTDVTLPGYDPESNQYLVHKDCKITEAVDDSGILKHQCDTLPGASGSPIIQNGKVVAVHIGSFKDEKREFNLAVDFQLIDTANLTATGLLEGYNPESFKSAFSSVVKTIAPVAKVVAAPVVKVVKAVVHDVVSVFGHMGSCFGFKGEFKRWTERSIREGSYAVVSGKKFHIPYNGQWPAAEWPYAQKADGCSLLENDRPHCMKDSWGPVNFREACNAHDRCYYTLNGPSEYQCNDVQFYGNLRASCERDILKNRPWLSFALPQCYSLATIYYLGVKGGALEYKKLDAFNKARTYQKEWLDNWVKHHINGTLP